MAVFEVGTHEVEASGVRARVHVVREWTVADFAALPRVRRKHERESGAEQRQLSRAK